MDAPDQPSPDLDADPSSGFPTMDHLLLHVLKGVEPEPGTTKKELEENGATTRGVVKA